MKNLSQILSGLLASLFVSVGCNRLAELFAGSRAALVGAAGAHELSSEACVFPCTWE